MGPGNVPASRNRDLNSAETRHFLGSRALTQFSRQRVSRQFWVQGADGREADSAWDPSLLVALARTGPDGPSRRQRRLGSRRGWMGVLGGPRARTRLPPRRAHSRRPPETANRAVERGRVGSVSICIPAWAWTLQLEVSLSMVVARTACVSGWLLEGAEELPTADGGVLEAPSPTLAGITVLVLLDVAFGGSKAAFFGPTLPRVSPRAPRALADAGRDRRPADGRDRGSLRTPGVICELAAAFPEIRIAWSALSWFPAGLPRILEEDGIGHTPD